MLQINKKRLRRLWQFFVVVAGFATIMMLFMYSNQLNNRNYKMLYEQTESLSRVILRQAAATAYPAVANDQIEVLDGLAGSRRLGLLRSLCNGLGLLRSL